MRSKHPQFAAYLTKRRQDLGLSMYRVAKLTGFSPALVKWWEDGQGLPKLASLEPLAQALEVSYEDLVTAAGHTASGLPEPEPYLRAKFPGVSERKLAEATRLFDQIEAAERRSKRRRR
jgi:transcriptional regulator with XRE-family HTH domain